MLFLNQYVTGDFGDGPWLIYVWLCGWQVFIGTAPIAEVRPEVHQIHPVQSTGPQLGLLSRILKSLIKVGYPSRFKSFLSDF